jgi:hypothetical protein
MRIASAGAPPGAGVPAPRDTDILTTANVSRSSTGAISGAYRSGERSAKSATSRPQQSAEGVGAARPELAAVGATARNTIHAASRLLLPVLPPAAVSPGDDAWRAGS